MKKMLAIGISGVLATGLSLAAVAQGGVNTEISTAHKHAGFAQAASTVAVSHLHLHHVINCLVGPKGAGFDAAAGNPCKGQGNGALPDSGNNPALHSKLETVLKDAQAGLKADTLAAAHAAAGKTAAALADTPTQKAKGGYSW